MRRMRKKKLRPVDKAIRFKIAIYEADIAIRRGDPTTADIEIIEGLRFLDSEAQDYISWHARSLSDSLRETISLREWLGCSASAYRRFIELANQRSLK